jgi:chromosome segregation protein
MAQTATARPPNRYARPGLPGRGNPGHFVQDTRTSGRTPPDQQAIVQRALSALTAISEALDKLNRKAGGLGARLDSEVIPPATPDQDWRTRVIPRWRRNPGGAMLPYDNVTNTAQEKLFSIHLALASLLAAPYPRGRILILDELADSLGAEHRREVLDAIASVAKQHGITILATCQDGIMAEARPHCGEILSQ